MVAEISFSHGEKSSLRLMSCTDLLIACSETVLWHWPALITFRFPKLTKEELAGHQSQPVLNTDTVIQSKLVGQGYEDVKDETL